MTASRLPTPDERLPFSTTIATREQIELSGAVMLEDVLRSVPGLQFGTQGNAYSRIATRGFRDTADVLVLVDGVPFRQLNGAADLTMLPVANIDRVEFVKGPGSALYGRGAVGGVLQIFTQPPGSTPSFEQQFSAGSQGFLESRTRASVPFEDGRFAIQAGASHTDGFQRGTDRDVRFVSASIERRMNDWLTIGAMGLYSDVDARRGSIIPLINGRPAYGVTRRDNYAIPGSRFEGEYGSLAVPITVDLGSGWKIRELFNINRYSRFATGGLTIVPGPTAVSRSYSEADTVQDTVQNELMLQWTGAALGGDVALAFGVNTERGTLRQDSPSFTNAPTYRAPDFNTPVTNIRNDPRGIRGPIVRTKADQSVDSLFVNADYTLGRWALFTGLRWDGFETTLHRSDTAASAKQNADRVTARFGTSYRIYDDSENQVTIFANYTEGFKPQFPAFSTQSGMTIAQLLQPEFTRSYEGGIKVQALEGRLYAEASIFRLDRVDAQRSYRVSPEDFLFTNAQQRVSGTEIQVQAQLTDAISGYLTYSYQDARNTSFVTNIGDFSGNTVRMAPRHFAGAGANWRIGDLNLNASANYIGSRPLRDNQPAAQVQTLPSYTIINASIRYDFDRFFVQGTVNNIANTFYISDDFSGQDAGSAGPGRAAYVTIGARF
ncbi:MAG TPA: TonB-dependent receptor [Roseomonas sp.]|nr:TonB-dependent receptor [Roseomonas sp.]